MSATSVLERDALEDLLGDETEQSELEADALRLFGAHDNEKDPQAIATVILTVRVRC